MNIYLYRVREFADLLFKGCRKSRQPADSKGSRVNKDCLLLFIHPFYCLFLGKIPAFMRLQR